MKWIATKNEMPLESAPYLVSLRKIRNEMPEFSLYIAYYSTEKNKWFKYYPFDNGFEPTEEIDGAVVAWSNDIPAYVG